MKALKHITEQPFIFATGLAALIHSTWALGTLFAGQAPDTSRPVEFAFWLVPALLIAFAMDVGQISTSAQIREQGMTFARGMTFGVFALATYYLQWLYIAHHMPALDLAAGVSALHRPFTIFLRDMGIWIIPALLPLSTLMYTFSGQDGNAKAVQPASAASSDLITISAAPESAAPRLEAATLVQDDSALLQMADTPAPPNVLWCACGWTTGERDTLDIATRALRVHQSRYCELIENASANGNGLHQESEA